MLDAPCGGGVALRAILPRQSLRYLGLGISKQMLGRFTRRAINLGVEVETRQADLREMPVPDGVADLCLSYKRPSHASRPSAGTLGDSALP